MPDKDHPVPGRDPQPPGQTPETGPPAFDAERLLRGGREARLVYHGVVYRLVVTKNGKLLLQK